MKIQQCPNCTGKLKIREYVCEECQLTLRGEFESPWFSSLSREQLEFARLFIVVQGNIKEMEKRLSISYPTVKNRLAGIISMIGVNLPSENDFNDIMNDLDEGFIDVDEAIKQIEARRKT